MSPGPPEPEVSPQKRLTLSTGLCHHCGGPLPDRPNRGSARRFCSARCRRLGWQARRPPVHVQARLVGLRDGLRLLRAQVDDRLTEVEALLCSIRRDERQGGADASARQASDT
jgi:hypothetical protein